MYCVIVKNWKIGFSVLLWEIVEYLIEYGNKLFSKWYKNVKSIFYYEIFFDFLFFN